MLKIDFQKLRMIQIENSEAISLQTLQSMLLVVLNFSDTSFKLAPNNVQLALNTLKDLGVIVETTETTKNSDVRQLNS